MQGDPVAAQNKHHKQRQDEDAAYEAQLLHHDREDKVVLRFGQELVFLPAVAQPQPQQSTRANAQQRLLALVAHLADVRIKHTHKSGAHIGLKQDNAQNAHTGDAAQSKQQFEGNARHKHHRRRTYKQQHGTRHMRLKQHQRGKDPQNAHIVAQLQKSHPFGPVAQRTKWGVPVETAGLAAFPNGQAGGEKEDDGHLGDLRGLIGRAGKQQHPQPALSAVARHTQRSEYQHQQHKGHRQQHNGPKAQLLIIVTGDGIHDDQTAQGVFGLIQCHGQRSFSAAGIGG